MTPQRWAWVEVDAEAIAHNVGLLRATVAPADLWAVVKADGYGHGAAVAARAAVSAGASGLCVALVQEGMALRDAGIAGTVLVLSEQPVEQLGELVDAGLTATVYRAEYVTALADAAERAGRIVPVHVKVDTGMHRVGAEPGEVAALCHLVAEHASLRLDGIYTHLATADEPDSATAALQLARFDELVEAMEGTGGRPRLVHAANSAAALALPRARRSLVRAGIAIYGIVPGPGVADRCAGLRPALSLKARVSRVAVVPAGEGVSYGWRTVLDEPTHVATVPIGYADGVPRRLSGVGGEVLIGGRRRRILGVVTMDQLMVDVGPADGRECAVEVGDEVVLLGTQGAESVRAEEWADKLGTIGYEIVCGLSPRLPRR